MQFFSSPKNSIKWEHGVHVPFTKLNYYFPGYLENLNFIRTTSGFVGHTRGEIFFKNHILFY